MMIQRGTTTNSHASSLAEERRQLQIRDMLFKIGIIVRILLYILLKLRDTPLPNDLFQVIVVLEVIYNLSFLAVNQSGVGSIFCYINLGSGSIILELLLWITTSLTTRIFINICIIFFVFIFLNFPPQIHNELASNPEFGTNMDIESSASNPESGASNLEFGTNMDIESNASNLESGINVEIESGASNLESGINVDRESDNSNPESATNMDMNES